MDRVTMIKRSVLGVSALLLIGYGCERQNPNKLAGDLVTGEQCPAPPETSGGNQVTPTTGSGNNTTTGGSTSGSGGSTPTGSSGSSNPTTTSGGNTEVPKTELDARVLDYSEALRIASLKLVGTLPTNKQIYAVADVPDADKKAKYTELVDQMLADSRFSQRMVEYFRETFKMYGVPTDASMPSRETAPTFAAQLVVEQKPFSDLLTAKANTCPTVDMATGVFTPAACSNAASVKTFLATMGYDQEAVGMLTNPGALSLFYGNLAMRRNRFFHETFLCRSGNASGGAEPTATPSKVGHCGSIAPANYTSPWDMSSISGQCNSKYSSPAQPSPVGAPLPKACDPSQNGAPCGTEPEAQGRIDFHTWNASVVCANCHSTWNHRAPLWAVFDEKGMVDLKVDDPATPCPSGSPNLCVYPVRVPVEGGPRARIQDWLPDADNNGLPDGGFAWKFNMPVKDIVELGATMASDPEVIDCTVKRFWNYAMSRGDIVENGATVPSDVEFLKTLVANYKANNHNMKQLLREILLGDDFTRF